jgi:hypothetical protein
MNKHHMCKTWTAQPRRSLFTRALLWTTIVFIVLAVSGCKKDPKVEFIQGAWYYQDAHLANIPAESAQVTNWEFDNYYFSVDTCCFYEANYSGYYSVTDRDENKLTLELYNIRGQIGGTVLNDDTMTIIIKLDPETDTIKISGDGPYTRASPQSS